MMEKRTPICLVRKNRPAGYLLPLLLLLCASCAQAQVKSYKVKVVQTYPHETDAYTQGLFFHDGTLYETTGQYGSSTLRTVDLASGTPLSLQAFAAKYFVEGSVVLGDDLYILTWQNKVAFRYDAATRQYRRTLSYPREGWGLTTDGKQLIASDGSATLYFLDTDLRVQRRLSVTIEGRPLRLLNELEWIDGRIWANVYMSDLIVIIHPGTGKVEATLDCSDLLTAADRRPDTDVLNGIAVSDDGRIYITGKYWPKLFEIEKPY